MQKHQPCVTLRPKGNLVVGMDSPLDVADTIELSVILSTEKTHTFDRGRSEVLRVRIPLKGRIDRLDKFRMKTSCTHTTAVVRSKLGAVNSDGHRYPCALLTQAIHSSYIPTYANSWQTQLRPEPQFSSKGLRQDDIDSWYVRPRSLDQGL